MNKRKLIFIGRDNTLIAYIGESPNPWNLARAHLSMHGTNYIPQNFDQVTGVLSKDSTT